MLHNMLLSNNNHCENFTTPALAMSIISKTTMIAVISEDEDEEGTCDEDEEQDDDDEDEDGEYKFATVFIEIDSIKDF